MTYIVKKGDNLTKIAKQNGLTLNQLLSLNKNIKNPDYIQIGQKINLKGNEENKPILKVATQNRTTPVLYKNLIESPKSESTSVNKIYKEYQAPEKKVTVKKQVNQKKEPSSFDNLKQNIKEKYEDLLTALDQQTAPKIATKPKVKIDDSFIDYGYKELGTYKDQSFKAGKNDSLLSAVNLFDNDKGFDYVVSPKVKEGKKTYSNVKGVAHFLMDSDITSNQKYTEPYVEKGNNVVKSAVKGKFIPYIGTNPSDYVMYYKNLEGGHINVKYGQLKDKDKYKGYDQIKVRSVPFSNLDFNKKIDAGFLKKASYLGTYDGGQTSIITDPNSNDVFGRFSGGSGVYHFKEPKTGKTLSMDVSGSVNTIKSVGEEIIKKYGINPKELQFLYHDMGSYSAKPKSHNGVLSNEQWQNYNVNNKGYSGAALMYPMEYGGEINDNKGYLLENLNNFTPKKIIKGSQYGTNITTNKLAFPILANNKVLYPNTGEYYFPESEVEEYPLKAQDGINAPLYSGDFGIKSKKYLNYDASNAKVGLENMKANFALNPVDMGIGVGSLAIDSIATGLSTLGKDGSKAQAFGEGASNAMNIAGNFTKPFESIPVVGKALGAAGKTLGFIIGGALEARRQAIENKEMEYYNDVRNFNERNSVAVNQPSHFGQYMAEYGMNIEDKLINEIYNDFENLIKNK